MAWHDYKKPGPKIFSNPSAAPEQLAELATLIEQVKDGLRGQLVGMRAAYRIESTRLWTLTHPTLKAFVADHFGMTLSYFLRLKKALAIRNELEGDPALTKWVDKPELETSRATPTNRSEALLRNERQYSAIAKAPKEHRAAVLERAASGGKLTEKSIEFAVKEHKAKERRQNAQDERAGPEPSESMSAAVASFLEARKAVRTLQKLIHDLSETPYGHRLRHGDAADSGLGQSTLHPLQAIWETLKFATPAGVCPTCEANPMRVALCQTCKRTGWLTELELKAVPMKPLIETGKR